VQGERDSDGQQPRRYVHRLSICRIMRSGQINVVGITARQLNRLESRTQVGHILAQNPRHAQGAGSGLEISSMIAVFNCPQGVMEHSHERQ
jgi:hypothetical protein